VSFIEQDGFYRISRKAADVLSASCLPLQNRISEDPGFSPFLIRFFDTEASNNNFICANYSSIYQSFLEFTNGSLLEDTQDIIPRLIVKLDKIPFVELLCKIVTKYFNFINDKNQFFEYISQAIRHAGYHAIGAMTVMENYISSLTEFNTDEPDLTCVFTSTFTAAAKDSVSPFFKKEAFGLIRRILMYNRVKYSALLADYQDMFDTTTPSMYLPSLLEIYPMKTLEHIDFLFDYPLFTALSKVIVNNIISIPIDKINEAFEKIGIVPKIVSHFNNKFISGHILRLCRYMLAKKSELPVLNCEEWNKLEEGILAEKIEVIKSNYGGYTGLIHDEDFVSHCHSPQISLTAATTSGSANWFDISSDDDSGDEKGTDPFA
jgi:hypothetical protein